MPLTPAKVIPAIAGLSLASALFVGAARAREIPPDALDQVSDAARAPDNSAINKNHDGRMGVSADQQKNDPSDVDLSRKIRRAIVKDKSLSVYAHNIKIIVMHSEVILKGPVRSDAEKLEVESKAMKIAGRERVISEIEVAAR